MGQSQVNLRHLIIHFLFTRSLVYSYRSFIRLFHTNRFARTLRCAHSFTLSLTHSRPSLSLRTYSYIWILDCSGPLCFHERRCNAWQISSYDLISLSSKIVKNRKLSLRFIFFRTVLCRRALLLSDKSLHFPK